MSNTLQLLQTIHQVLSDPITILVVSTVFSFAVSRRSQKRKNLEWKSTEIWRLKKFSKNTYYYAL